MMKQQIGVIGLAVMGKNIALNMESKGFSVAVFNRSYEKTENFLANEASGKNFVGAKTIEEFVDSLEKPRKIMLMVKAGPATDATIESLKPHLDKGDILIDGGNTLYEDTIRRNKELDESGIHFIGTGVSGGEEGALNGPSIMPGGQAEAYKLVAPIFEAISAKVDHDPCVTYIGPNGAGHFVKMVHNGIEYGDMQLIAEAYDLMKNVLGLDATELHNVFKDWNDGELDSYLIEITADIFTKVDEETGKPLVEVILDKAGQKGTGKWTSKNALDLGVPLPLITESVFARFISSLKDERVRASKELNGPTNVSLDESKEELIEAIRQALYMSKIVSYAQGFAQMRAASDEYDWNLSYGDIAMIWRGGCIIRAKFLQKIKDAYDRDAQLPNLMLDSYFKEIVEGYQSSLRKVVSLAVAHGIAVPTLSSAIAYYDSYRSEDLPANLIQAQRDYFGAHTYERKDKEGVFHSQWF
ncbi:MULTISPECIES: NADP-dependent phosphogluconate dehydrogenase [Oceanobacillus]|uniref:6-phosphogluconate dehydrogenase, decarboxylating n=3 Tax=Bacteria TaxID=2 RepID=A0ABQ5TCQ6_9BACI|nr:MULTISPECIES: NADP-dependent phosphogluconate dehydrogenase [Oceanobacillus]MBT2601282.1 NADP-dependent phosphogluconate dehydrogenase [Oceanobacillus sp. ISL-74]MBT2653345.1 NADP-dependent phosphogluconate dehydrogenase [Oceanobacillus sp. ISL-73]GLO64374.1 6-phosphogluconate dehydrogenase, NADP(+)-dependent, decarboxylating [Oceanobacillus kimchii]